MANNYVQFSVLLDVRSAANVERAMEIAEKHCAEDGLSFDIGRQSQFDPASTAVWIYAEEAGNVDSVVRYAVKVGKALNLSGVWGMTYAETCSKPALGVFGGGAVRINLRTGKIKAVHSHEWLSYNGGDPYQGSLPKRSNSADL